METGDLRLEIDSINALDKPTFVNINKNVFRTVIYVLKPSLLLIPFGNFSPAFKQG